MAISDYLNVKNLDYVIARTKILISLHRSTNGWLEQIARSLFRMVECDYSLVASSYQLSGDLDANLASSDLGKPVS